MARENIKRKNPTRWKVSKFQNVADEVVRVKIAFERRQEQRTSAERSHNL